MEKRPIKLLYISVSKHNKIHSGNGNSTKFTVFSYDDIKRVKSSAPPNFDFEAFMFEVLTVVLQKKQVKKFSSTVALTPRNITDISVHQSSKHADLRPIQNISV